MVGDIFIAASTHPAVVTALGGTPVLSDTVISVGPLWDALVPYIAAGLGLIITAAATWAAYQFQRFTGMKLDQNARDALHSAAATGVNLALTEAGKTAHEASFSVKNAVVGQAANWVIQSVPDALKRLNVTPDKITAIVTAKLGELQNAKPVQPVRPTPIATPRTGLPPGVSA